MIVFKAHSQPILALEFTPDGRSLVTSGRDEFIRLWSGDPMAKVREWPGSEHFSPISISRDGRFIAAGGYGMKVWPVDGSDEPLLNTSLFTQSLKFSPDGRVLATQGQSRGTLTMRSVPEFEPLGADWSGPKAIFTGGMAFDPVGNRLALGFGEHRRGDLLGRTFVDIRQTNTWEQTAEFPRTARSLDDSALCFSPDGSMLAGTFGTVLNVWDLENQVEVASRKVGALHFKDLAFTADGHRLLTVSNDQIVRVWETENWSESGAFAWKIGKLSAVAVSPDGCRFAAGGSTGKVVIWDAD